MTTPKYEIVVEIVSKILNYFLYKREKSQHSRDHRYFDIELSRENNYLISVTNCGHSETNICEIVGNCFVQLLSQVELECCVKTIEFVVKEEEQEEEQVYDLRWSGYECKMCFVATKRQSEHFAHLKKYLSLRLEFKIYPKNNELLKKCIIEELVNLDNQETNVKYIFRSGNEIFWRNEVEVDRAIENCRLVGSAIQTMIQNTRNRGFREQCLRLLCVNEPSEIEEQVTNKIASLIREKHRTKRNNTASYHESRKKRMRRNQASK